MPFKDIYFSEFLPDRGGFPFPKDPGYLVEAKNVRPTTGGYRPMAIDEVVTNGATLGATPISAAGFAVVTTAKHFVGSATALYESDDIGVTWYDNSRGGYTTTGWWDFDLFGDYVIAVNGVDAPQYKLITDAVSTNFDDLPGNPPVASLVCRVREHVVLGGLTSNYYAIQFGKIGDPETWPTPGGASALANQAGLRDMPHELGIITQLVGGEKFGLIFQVSGISRMTYVGGNVVWQIDTFERARGSGFRNSAKMVNGWCYFANALGFFRTDGHQVENLSEGRIQDAIVRDFLSLTEATSAFGWSVAYDSRTSTVMWSTSSSYVLCYHIPYERFSLIYTASTPSLSTLYAVRNNASTEGALEIPYAFNSTPKLVSFTDQTSVPVALRTGYFELVEGWAEITGLEPIGAGSSLALACKSIAALSSADLSPSTYTSAASPVRSHRYGIRQSGRYHSLKVTDTSGADDLYAGVRVYYEPASEL